MHLTKAWAWYSILFMGHSYFGLLDLGAERMACRRSLLMEATSFRVGTFFNSLFLPLSIAAISQTRNLESQNEGKRPASVTLKQIQKDPQIIHVLPSINKPLALTISAHRGNVRRLFQRANGLCVTVHAFVLNCGNIFWFYRPSRLNGHVPSGVSL
jgi:hypothetical protein